MWDSWDSPTSLISALTEQGYLLDEEAATALFLALALEKPCLLEGPAGLAKLN